MADQKIQYRCSVKALYHEKFALIRELDKINIEHLLESLSIEKNQEKVFQAGESAGASGSFFFFSHDNRFLIKTVSKSEKQVIDEILDEYICHLSDTQNKSLLARIYGLFLIESSFFKNVYIILMQNTSNISDNNNIKYKFDLKGSRVSRYVDLGEKPKSKKFIN